MYWSRGRLKERLAGQGNQFELKRRVISKKVVFETRIPVNGAALNGESQRVPPSPDTPMSIPIFAASISKGGHSPVAHASPVCKP
jgi:hypothetical protein